MHNPDRLDFGAPVPVKVVAGRWAGRTAEAVGISHKENRFVLHVELGNGSTAVVPMAAVEMLSTGRVERGSAEEQRCYATSAAMLKQHNAGRFERMRKNNRYQAPWL